MGLTTTPRALHFAILRLLRCAAAMAAAALRRPRLRFGFASGCDVRVRPRYPVLDKPRPDRSASRRNGAEGGHAGGAKFEHCPSPSRPAAARAPRGSETRKANRGEAKPSRFSASLFPLSVFFGGPRDGTRDETRFGCSTRRGNASRVRPPATRPLSSPQPSPAQSAECSLQHGQHGQHGPRPLCGAASDKRPRPDPRALTDIVLWSCCCSSAGCRCTR